MLRESDIVKDPKHPERGLLALTRTPFRDAVALGYIPKPVRLGRKMVAWPRGVILRILLDGTGAPRKARAPAAKLNPSPEPGA
jgi:predicted DNA-binding transcriptional regulator AlpA